jgi:hypothetical protein
MALQKITTIPIWKNTTVGSGSAGGTAYSDPIDLRDINAKNNLSLSYSVAAVTGSTNGTSLLVYTYCPVYNGTYVLAGTFGTITPAGETGIKAISSPPIMPFIKVGVISGTSALTKVTAELHVQ